MCSVHYDSLFMSSPKVVPWDANPWDSWDWDKNLWDSPGIFSFGTQIQGTKIIGTGSPVPCPSLVGTIEKMAHSQANRAAEVSKIGLLAADC